MIINNWTNLKARRKKREKQIPTTFDERKTKCKRVCELRVRAFTWLRATNEVSCVIPEAMVLSTRCARGERRRRRREGAWGIDVVWQSRCTPLFASSAATSTAAETTFRRQLRSPPTARMAGVVLLIAPDHALHPFAPRLRASPPPSQGTRTRWCIRGCTTPSTSLASTLRGYYETRGSTVTDRTR